MTRVSIRGDGLARLRVLSKQTADCSPTGTAIAAEGFGYLYGVGRGGGVGRGLGVGTNLGVGVCLGVALGVVVAVAVAVGVAVAVAVDVAVAVGVGVGVAVVVFTVTVTGSEAIPFATTSRELLPVSAAAGTSKFVETFSAPVATPIVLCPWVRA